MFLILHVCMYWFSTFSDLLLFFIVLSCYDFSDSINIGVVCIGEAAGAADNPLTQIGLQCVHTFVILSCRHVFNVMITIIIMICFISSIIISICIITITMYVLVIDIIMIICIQTHNINLKRC